jgi:hypothetical protein
MSLSYYRGRNDIPVAVSTVSDLGDTIYEDGKRKQVITTDVIMHYPKKTVVGFDLAGQVPFLDDAGLWFEGAFIFPETVKMEFDITRIIPGSMVIIDDTVVKTPFFKCTTGMDYTINEYVFITGQYIHGFVDEFGANNINDYWVGGFDMKFFQDQLLIRLFFIGEIPHEDTDITLDLDDDGVVDATPGAKGATDDGTIASYVIFPQITYRPVDGLELSLGGYFLLGHQESKFAMNAAGPSLVFFRVRASY